MSQASLLRRAFTNVPDHAREAQEAYAASREQHRIAYQIPRHRGRFSRNVDDGEAAEVEPVYVAPVEVQANDRSAA